MKLNIGCLFVCLAVFSCSISHASWFFGRNFVMELDNGWVPVSMQSFKNYIKISGSMEKVGNQTFYYYIFRRRFHKKPLLMIIAHVVAEPFTLEEFKVEIGNTASQVRASPNAYTFYDREHNILWIRRDLKKKKNETLETEIGAYIFSPKGLIEFHGVLPTEDWNLYMDSFKKMALSIKPVQGKGQNAPRYNRQLYVMVASMVLLIAAFVVFVVRKTHQK